MKVQPTTKELIAMLYERLPELFDRAAPVHEPVAWWIPKAEQFCLQSPSGKRPFAKAWEPLYATPPAAQRQWVGLEAEDRLCAKYMQDAPDGIEAVIDYIEAKLKEKNGGQP
jgi:hypothetical protein